MLYWRLFPIPCVYIFFDTSFIPVDRSDIKKFQILIAAGTVFTEQTLEDVQIELYKLYNIFVDSLYIQISIFEARIKQMKVYNNIGS